MSMYGKNHYNIVISLQPIKINGKKKLEVDKQEMAKVNIDILGISELK